MERKNYRVLVDTGSAADFVASPTVSVYNSGSAVLASIFDDEGITPKANPFTGPSTGLVYFYAPDGKYDIVFVGGTPDLGAGYTLGAELFDDTLSLSSGGGGITTLNALTALSQTFTTGTAGTDFAISSAVSTHTFNLPFATNTTNGKLSAADWTTFNAKIGTLNGLTNVSQTLAIGSTGNSPNWVSASGTHTLNLPFASATRSGILSSADWIAFNAKADTFSGGTTSDYLRGGDITFQPLTTSAVTEGSRLYYTDARVRAAISGSSPIAFSGAGVISIQTATSAQPGALSAADWTTFNNKISSVTTDAAGTDFGASTAAGAVTISLPVAAPSITGGKVTNAAQTFSGVKTLTSQLITQAGRRRYVRYHTVGTVVVAAGLDDLIVINKTIAGATAVTLPAGVTGETYTIKDGKGDAGANNITVTPTAGNIDGAGTNVISTNYLSRTYVYNGTEWNVVA